MVLVQEQATIVNPVSSVVKATVISAFTFLTALAVRDVFSQTVESVLPAGTGEKLLYTYLYAALVLFVTVLLATFWNTSSGTP